MTAGRVGPAAADLSTLIVSWNTRALLDACLASVFADLGRAEGGLSGDVWVVDNASADGSPEMVRTKYPEVRLRENAENAGFARASNQAIRESAGRWVVLLNS